MSIAQWHPLHFSSSRLCSFWHPIHSTFPSLFPNFIERPKGIILADKSLKLNICVYLVEAAYQVSIEEERVCFYCRWRHFSAHQNQENHLRFFQTTKTKVIVVIEPGNQLSVYQMKALKWLIVLNCIESNIVSVWNLYWKGLKVPSKWRYLKWIAQKSKFSRWMH